MSFFNKLNRELIEWTVILSVPLFLYMTGTHTEVIGQIQRVLLMPGFIQPNLDLPESEQLPAVYDFELMDFKGNETSLQSLKGKTIFLNFWATWCSPCVAEMPDIQSLYHDIRNDNIAFVLVSMDQNRDKAFNFIERKKFDLPVYSPRSAIPSIYQSGSIPTTFVISPDGRVVSKHVGMAKYNTSRFKNFLLGL